MDASTQAVGCLGIDCAKAHQTPKRRLDMPARTAKPVVKVEMAKCGVEIVAPHQNHDPTAEPNAFGISGRTVDGLRSFDEFVGFALAVLGGVSGGSGTCGRRFARLILGAKVAALGDRTSNADQKCKPGDSEVAQNCIF
jgi:hypothetical protein